MGEVHVPAGDVHKELLARRHSQYGAFPKGKVKEPGVFSLAAANSPQPATGRAVTRQCSPA